MITIREIQLAQDAAGELRARGADEKAAAIEHMIATATALGSGPAKVRPRELFTIGQAARALAVSAQAIQTWVGDGHLQTVRRGDRVMIPRASLLAFLDQLRRTQPVTAGHPVESEEAGAGRAFVLSGLAPEKVERVQVLGEKIEASQPLTPAEEDELEHLQVEFARVSWIRLKRWAERQSTGT